MRRKLKEVIILITFVIVSVGWVLLIFYAIEEHQDYCATVEYRGHSYILLHSDGESATTHDPDCPCHKNNPELLNEK